MVLSVFFQCQLSIGPCKYLDVLGSSCCIIADLVFQNEPVAGVDTLIMITIMLMLMVMVMATATDGDGDGGGDGDRDGDDNDNIDDDDDRR